MVEQQKTSLLRKKNIALPRVSYYFGAIVPRTAILRSALGIAINIENTPQASPVYRDAQTGGLLLLGDVYAIR